MMDFPKITRPPKEIIDALRDIGAATVAGTLGHMGFRSPHMLGPAPQTHGKSIVGPALTLQFLPQRPDLFSEGEYADRLLATVEKTVHVDVPAIQRPAVERGFSSVY